jgi:3-oxoacyl-[acyl-carrier protein] reductase
MLLESKRVVVTAAAGAGIGFATARRALEEGATVFLSDAHAGRLGEAVNKLRADHGERVAGGRAADVTSTAAVDAMIDVAATALGGLDVLVNNAGITIEKPLVELTDGEWEKVVDICLTGTFRGVRAALRHMSRHGSGAIVNVGSVIGWRAQAQQGPYAAAKAGVMALTRVAAAEGAAHGVRVNCVSPSLALNPFLTKVVSEQTLAEELRLEAFGRGAEPEEVANVILFLASDLASYMTGETVSVSSQHP